MPEASVKISQLMTLVSLLSEYKFVSRKLSLGTVIVAGEYINELYNMLTRLYTPVAPFWMMSDVLEAKTKIEQLVRDNKEPHSPIAE